MRYGILLLLWASTLHAEAFDYYSAKDGLTAQAPAVFHLKVQNGLNCSGVYITPDGDALTNLHCVEPCLLASDKITHEPLGNLTKNAVRTPATCNAEILVDGKITSQVIQINHVFGPGFLSPREGIHDFQTQHPDQFTALLTEGYEGRGDLVLIHVPLKTKCIRLAPADLSGPEPVPVQNLSYAIVVREIPGNSSPVDHKIFMALGTNLLFTKGAASANPSFVAKQFGNPDELRYVQQNWGPGTFLSSIDVEGGSSGSPVLDATGGLLGIARSTFNGNSGDYRAWMAEAIDLSVHAQTLSELAPTNALCN